MIPITGIQFNIRNPLIFSSLRWLPFWIPWIDNLNLKIQKFRWILDSKISKITGIVQQYMAFIFTCIFVILKKID